MLLLDVLDTIKYFFYTMFYNVFDIENSIETVVSMKK